MSHIPNNPFMLIDGSSYLFRAYHALPPLTNSKGEPTGAIYGFVQMLNSLLEKFKPTNIAIVFDTKKPNFRHKLLPEYKANRLEMQEDLAVQIPIIHKIIQAMGIPIVMRPGIEADDVLATLAVSAANSNKFTVLVTSDKDMAQIVNDKIVMLNTMNENILDSDKVLEKYGVYPEQIADYLALIGDSVDNIPGVNKVGPKTAAKWLQEYGSLEQIILNADKISGKVGENLRNTLDKLPIYKEVTTLKCDLELNIEYKDLQQLQQDPQELQELYKNCEFKSLIVKSESEFSFEYELILTEIELQRWYKLLKKSKLIAFDTETTSLNSRDAELVGLSFAVDQQSCYIPVGHDYEDMPYCLPLKLVLNKLKTIFADPEIAKIGQNLKYDLQVLENYNIAVAGCCFDTMLESYIINSTGNKHALDSLALKYLDYKTVLYTDIAGKGSKQLNFSEVSVEAAAYYAAEDAAVTFALHKKLYAILEQTPSLLKVFANLEMPLIKVLLKMEQTGVLIDKDALNLQSKFLEEKLLALKDQAFLISQQQFNLNSPKQLQEVLFDKLNLPVIKKTPTGQASTGEEVLQELALDYELPRIILEYRSLSKLKSTYTDKLPKEIHPKTNRVHTSYHQAVTATGRLSSSDPNLQNIPIRTELGRKIRQAFIAPENYKLLAADYSQIELRIMAHLSQDVTLLDAFAKNEDVHSRTAAEIFNVNVTNVASEQRRKAKAINFGLIYGMSAFGLARQLKISQDEAAEYMDFYFKTFPGVKKFMEETKENAKINGFVETMFGRRLYLPDINSKQVIKRKAAERAAINAPMQGAQADIIKLAMLRIDETINSRYKQVKMIMQVHDELVFEVPDNLTDSFSLTVKKIMSGAAQLQVPLLVEVGIGANWDEAH